MKFNYKTLAVLISIVVMLGGCATQVPTLNFTPANIFPNEKKVDAELKGITISIAQEEERLGETQVGFFGNIYEQSFRTALKTALEEAIARSAAFNDLSNRKVSLMAKVMKFQSPSAGINFDTDMIIRYELIDRSTGQLVFFRDVSSHGSVPGDYAFLGATRYTEARNRCVRDNVRQLIDTFEEIELAPISKDEINIRIQQAKERSKMTED